MMKIGIFGGTFDPPHLSHTLACHYVLETSDLDKILVIPCYQHPFSKPTAPFEDRLEMCRLAMRLLRGRVEVSAIESEIGGVSYTIDTVRELKSRHPDALFELIIGSDILKETAKWKDFEELKRMVTLRILPRIGLDASQQTPEREPFFLPDISSTMVREKLKRRESVDQYLARSVIDYIAHKRLYLG
jgi:nicotinate-nucleotide adenylyltransferase